MFLIRYRPRAMLFLAVVCSCAGCGPGRPRVEGNVTLDGTPVDGGSISFFQGSGVGSDKGNAPIRAGKYVIAGSDARNLTPGSYTVHIYWVQKIAKSRPNPNPANTDANTGMLKQLIPPQYNTKSTLTREITPGTNKLDFELKSK